MTWGLFWLAFGIVCMAVGALGIVIILIDWIYSIPERIDRYMYRLVDEALTDAWLEDQLIDGEYLSRAVWLERHHWIDR